MVARWSVPCTLDQSLLMFSVMSETTSEKLGLGTRYIAESEITYGT